MDNAFDNTTEDRYNTSNDEYVAIVKMDEQVPANDTTCRHTQLKQDPEDTLGNAVMHMCTNPKCGVGFYIQPK